MRVARSGTHRPRTGSAAGGDKQCALPPAGGAPASPRGERDPHRRIADDGGATGNYDRRGVVQASGRNAKMFSRSSGIAASYDGNRWPLQLAARIGKTHLSGVPRARRRIGVFVFVEAELRWRAQTLQAAAPGSAFAADARTRGHRKTASGAIFSAGVGHRGGSAAPRHSCGGARVGGKLHGHLLPRHFVCLPAALGPLLRAFSERAARRLPGHRH